MQASAPIDVEKTQLAFQVIVTRDDGSMGKVNKPFDDLAEATEFAKGLISPEISESFVCQVRAAFARKIEAQQVI